jgi:hypothetical protein
VESSNTPPHVREKVLRSVYEAQLKAGGKKAGVKVDAAADKISGWAALAIVIGAAAPGF